MNALNLKKSKSGEVICRLDGVLAGVSGPLVTPCGKKVIAETLGWNPDGEWVQKIWNLIRDGKTVKAKCSTGFSYFCPLNEDEDGRSATSANRYPVYDPSGNVIERLSRTH